MYYSYKSSSHVITSIGQLSVLYDCVKEKMTSFASSSGAMSTADDETSEILQLTQEAFNLANVAILFDKQDNFIGAYDYYDKCILNIDEVMSKLPRSSLQWKKLMEIRSQYDDRMDQLKEMENNKNSMMSNFGLTSSKPIDMSKQVHKSSKNKHKLTEDMNFSEINVEGFQYEEPPKDMQDIPYWQLRCIQRTIETGGYLSDSLFIPMKVWQQTDVKFSGIQIKSTAFEIIIRLITNQVEILSMRIDEATVAAAEQVFSSIAEELLALQNQLSKSFNYIKENVVTEKEENELYNRESLYSNSTATNSISSSTSSNNLASQSGKNVVSRHFYHFLTIFFKFSFFFLVEQQVS